MNNSLAIARFAKKPRHSRAIIAEFLAQHFHGHQPVVRMLCAEHCGRATFAHFVLERVASQRAPDQILPWHGGEPNTASLGQASERTLGYDRRFSSSEARAGGIARFASGILFCAFALACATGRRTQNAPAPSVSKPSPARAAADPLAAYRQEGFLVTGEPFPLIGTVHALASPTPESTLVLVTFSLSNRVLTFARDGEQYHATYDVVIELRADSSVVGSYTSREVVRVGSFRETSRGEESVIFQKYFALPPGEYGLSMRASDSASGRYALLQARVAVPRLDDGSATAPIAVYNADNRRDRGATPTIVPNPRNTVVFGRDSVLTLYVESYGPLDSVSLPVRVLDHEKRPILFDTLKLARHREILSGTATLQVARLGWGAIYVELRSPGGSAAVVPVIVSLGEGLVVTTYDEMLEYLRFYASSERLRALREASAEQRPVVWARFLRETDPAPSTVEHEGLRAYFNLVEQANARFHDEGIPGWMTDRGMVYVTLGEPDNIFEPRGPQSVERGRAQVWEYTRHRVQLMFIDATGFGKWRLAPYSEAEFASVARRVRVP